METRVGLWVRLTARVRNQKASKVMTAATGRERGAVSSLGTE